MNNSSTKKKQNRKRHQGKVFLTTTGYSSLGQSRAEI